MPRHRARRHVPPLHSFMLVFVPVIVVAGVVVAGHGLLAGPVSAPEASTASPRPQQSSHQGGMSPAPSASPSRSRTARSHPPGRSRTANPERSRPVSPSPRPGSAQRGSADSRAEAAVLAQVNRARAGAALPAYVRTRGLQLSAGRHNALMAAGCGLSHQCPGEADIGARETAAGVHWTAAGENIGEGGPVSSGSIAAMAERLTSAMLNEKPPDDGHRLNLLSSTFTHIGIVIYRDKHGIVWMTQDFSN